MRLKNGCLVFLFCYCCSGFAQLDQFKNFGINVGFISAFGSHQQRFGVVVQGYCLYEFAQLNASFRVYDNFKDFGPKGEHAELNAAIGLCLGYGKKTNEKNLFVSSIGNQTGYKNSVAYSYNVWRNKINTSQVAGIISLQFNHFSIICENDLFAKPILDRFRTGAMILQYQYKQFQYSINGTMWTGQLGDVVKDDTIANICYISKDGGVSCTNLSHGLMSAQVKYANKYGQYIQGNIGVDAEQVRNLFQNKIIHSVIPNNYHIPMIDSEGNQYLYRQNQYIRKPKPYINVYTSPDIFY